MINAKTISIKEFREKGYLQELNRRYLHPLGLCLAIKLDEFGFESLDRILDYRDDDEGIVFGIKESNEERISRFKKNKKFIDQEFETRLKIRSENLGFGIEEV